MLKVKEPKISVVIPVLHLNDYLKKENFPAFTKQSYKNFEVIVLPNELKTKDKYLLKKYRWLRIIPTHSITRPAEKRDIGVKRAKGEIIAFIDDDAYPSPHWLNHAVHYFKTEDIEAICGAGILPDGVNIWEKIFDEVMKAWIGTGGYSYRFQRETARYVDDYPSMNFLVKKSIFNKVGGFNSTYWPGEDSKFCNDLVYKHGGKIFYHPDIYIYHHRRSKFQGYLNQHGNYGYHRGAFFAHGDKNSRRFGYLIPTFFVLYLLFCVIYTIFILATRYQLLDTIVFLPLFFYILLCLYIFLKITLKTKNIMIASGTIFVLFATHLWYGTMFVKGFVTSLIRRGKIY